MPFFKLKQHATPGICEPQLFNEAECKQMKHKIADYVKQCLKERLDKEPGNVRITIVDDMIIIRNEHYLTKMEKYIIGKESTGVETVRSIRIDAVTGIINEGGLVSFIEELIHAKALYSLYDVYPEDEQCVLLFVFDKKLA